MNFRKSFFLAIQVLFLWAGCDRKTELVEDPGIPPAVPTGIRFFFASDGEVAIEWNSSPEPDVKGYYIYRRTESTETIRIAYVNESFYFDDSLHYDTTYFYKLTAVNLWNKESDFSAEISTKPENRYKPKKPVGLKINARNWEGEVSVYLNWLKNEETDVEGYYIYRGTTAGFTPDTANRIGFSVSPDFSDSVSLGFYQYYYYKIIAKDKGGLLSIPADEVSDLIFEIPEVIFPQNNSVVEFFDEFVIKTINAPADYRIGLQTNKYFGEIWSSTLSSSAINDTLKINFNPPSLQVNKKYYWRIATYSGNSSDPNSISKIFTVTFKD